MAAELGYGFVDIEEPLPEPQTPSRPAAAWRKLIKKLFRIRFLQRTWGLLGGFLRTTRSAEIRDRIRDRL